MEPLSPGHPSEAFDLSTIAAAAIPRDTEGLEHRAPSHERGRQSTLCEGLRRPPRGPESLGNATWPPSAGNLDQARLRHPGTLLLPCFGPGGCDPMEGFIQHTDP